MLGAIKSAAQTVADGVQGLLGAGFDKVKTSVDEFLADSDQLEAIGYKVTAVELCCALSPCVTVFMSREAAPRDESFQALLARNQTNATMRTVANLLRQTEKIIVSFERPERRCTSVAVELGVPPRVRLIYTGMESRASGAAEDWDYAI
jgi:hypothetical protein